MSGNPGTLAATLVAGIVCTTIVSAPAAAQPPARSSAREPDLVALLDVSVANAEASLRENELQRAESQYRATLFDAWMIVGALHVADRNLSEAAEAFRHAAASAVDADKALQALALVHLQKGDPAQAVTILTNVAGRNSANLEAWRLLAQAQMAAGQPQDAVQTLEEAHMAASEDPELTFALASAYLAVKNVDAAERLFADVSKARPGPETDVLLGRTYRDYGWYDRARAALQHALKKDPRTRRAHYYLGTIAVLDEGVLRIEDAIREFRAELRLAPRDLITNLRVGIALVEVQRPAEALRHLEIAAGQPDAPTDAFYYLGRCQLALDRPVEAAVALRRALTSAEQASDDLKVRSIHYQLAQALRKAGKEAEAVEYFDKAKQGSARRAVADREELSRYMADAPEPIGAGHGGMPPLESPFAAQSPSVRAATHQRVRATIARAYLNLGVMQAQAQRFPRAVEFFEQAAAADPEFSRVQYSLGVAYFNAKQFEKATAPLARALAGEPANGDVRRMLALAWLNLEVYDKAAELLASDPARESDPSLQYAYGLALVRSDRAGEAEAIFSRLLSAHGDSAELQVVLGQAHAQQGDYEAAIDALRRALQLKSDAAEANTTLGIIYLKQGRLGNASVALRAELAVHPDDVRAQHTLAMVLDLDGHTSEAVSILERTLKTKPEYAPARYLLGKILLGRGATAAAIEQLQAAVRLSPEDADAHYQLGQAFQRSGRADLAAQQFAQFRALKDKQRGKTR